MVIKVGIRWWWWLDVRPSCRYESIRLITIMIVEAIAIKMMMMLMMIWAHVRV